MELMAHNVEVGLLEEPSVVSAKCVRLVIFIRQASYTSL